MPLLRHSFQQKERPRLETRENVQQGACFRSRHAWRQNGTRIAVFAAAHSDRGISAVPGILNRGSAIPCPPLSPKVRRLRS